jgi:MBG domain (YGX type)
VTYNTGELTITPKAITVKADDKTKVYGSADPALTVTVPAGALETGDSLTGNLERAAGNNVGSYAITKGTLTAGGNYDLTVTVGTLTITKKAITVTADDKTKVVGAVDPALTSKVTAGLLESGDSFTGALNRASGETVGSYAITQGTLTAGGNYTLTFVGATLKIVYAWDGFLQPINDTAHQTGVQQSKFKLGQTIPAKFVLENAAGAVVRQATDPAFTRSANLGACDSTAATDTAEAATPDAGSTFTWDGSQYHYNWSTRNLTAGEYRIYANLADGTKQYVDICLAK